MQSLLRADLNIRSLHVDIVRYRPLAASACALRQSDSHLSVYHPPFFRWATTWLMQWHPLIKPVKEEPL